MAYDPYCLAERIMSDLDSVLKKDPLMEEFDIIPVSESTNRSPVTHISHNVGIESWCVKTVFMYCYENIFKINPFWRREHLRLERYTRMALLLNPNIATFWNTRKKLILHQYLEVKSDLLLTKLILSRKPKCVEALAHRRWLIQHIFDGSMGWIEGELKLCEQLSNRMKCNYHAWSHRQWVYNLGNSCHGFNQDIWLAEFQSLDDWTKYHVSDHSGWHHRKFLLSHLKQNLTKQESDLRLIQEVLSDPPSNGSLSKFYATLLKDELCKSENLILSYSGHETLWYYRRFLLEAAMCEPNVLRNLNEETSFLNKCYCQTNTSTETSQRRLLDQHRLWLSRNWK